MKLYLNLRSSVDREKIFLFCNSEIIFSQTEYFDQLLKFFPKQDQNCVLSGWQSNTFVNCKCCSRNCDSLKTISGMRSNTVKTKFRVSLSLYVLKQLVNIVKIQANEFVKPGNSLFPRVVLELTTLLHIQTRQ